MPPTSVLFGLVCLFWAFYLLRPFFGRAVDGRSDVDALVEEKRGYLFALRDAELDHEAGKLSDDDYRAAQRRLETELTRVLAAIDSSGGGDAEARVRRRLEARQTPGDPS